MFQMPTLPSVVSVLNGCTEFRTRVVSSFNTFHLTRISNVIFSSLLVEARPFRWNAFTLEKMCYSSCSFTYDGGFASIPAFRYVPATRKPPAAICSYCCS